MALLTELGKPLILILEFLELHSPFKEANFVWTGLKLSVGMGSFFSGYGLSCE